MVLQPNQIRLNAQNTTRFVSAPESDLNKDPFFVPHLTSRSSV